VLRQAARSHRALAELKGAAASIPNETILIDTLALREAKDSSAIENIITTEDDLFQGDVISGRFPRQILRDSEQEEHLAHESGWLPRAWLCRGYDLGSSRRGSSLDGNLITESESPRFQPVALPAAGKRQNR
jgi:Fic/DOC family N-terminal